MALGVEFGSDSDIEVLVTFAGGAKWGIFDHVLIQQELQEILGQAVDLVSKKAVARSANWLRRDEILRSARVLYPAPDSDIDLLVEFEPGCEPGLIALAGVELELSGLADGRQVDLRTPRDLNRKPLPG